MFRAGSSTKKIKSYYQYLTSFRFRHAESDYEYAEAVLFGTRAALGIGRGGDHELASGELEERDGRRNRLCQSAY